MKLKELMNRSVEMIHPSESLQSAAHRMDNLGISLLAVVESEMPIGLISERDIITRAVALGLDPKITRVREVMTMNVDSLSEEEEVEQALRIMEEKQQRELIVHSETRRLAGVVTLEDLLQEVAEPQLAGASVAPSLAKSHPR